MFHVKLLIMKYIFSYSFLRNVAHKEFGGYETTEVLSSEWFYFDDFADFANHFVDSVLAAAAADLAGRGVRVYNFLDLMYLLHLSLEDFVASGSEEFSAHIEDQTSTYVPTGPVKSVVLYYTFSISQMP